MFSCRMCSHIECVRARDTGGAQSKDRGIPGEQAARNVKHQHGVCRRHQHGCCLSQPRFSRLGNLVCMDWLIGLRSLFTPLVPLSIACYFSPSPSPVTRLLLLLGSRHTTRPAHAGVGGHHTTVSSLFFIAYPQTRVPAPSVPGLCAGTAGAGPNPLSIALFSAS